MNELELLLTPEYRGLFLCAMFVFGACVGSFLNVCIWRMPLRESIVFAPSHCTKCNAHISWYDNIPLVSYLVLRGKCRKCKSHYTARYFFIELITALIFLALTALRADSKYAGLPLEFAAAATFIAVAVIDYEHRLIPNKLSYFLIIFALGWHLMYSESGVRYLIESGAVLLFFGTFAIVGKKIAKRTALGWGDVKLLTAIAAVFGSFPLIIITGGASIGGIFAGILLAWRHHKKLSGIEIPFGTYLSLISLVYLLAI